MECIFFKLCRNSAKSISFVFEIVSSSYTTTSPKVQLLAAVFHVAFCKVLLLICQATITHFHTVIKCNACLNNYLALHLIDVLSPKPTHIISPSDPLLVFLRNLLVVVGFSLNSFSRLKQLLREPWNWMVLICKCNHVFIH